jgi:hypothetical protein
MSGKSETELTFDVVWEMVGFKDEINWPAKLANWHDQVSRQFNLNGCSAPLTSPTARPFGSL